MTARGLIVSAPRSGAGKTIVTLGLLAALKRRGHEVRAVKAEKTIAMTPPSAPYDVVFLDPPYAVGDDQLREILLTLLAQGWLADDALVTVERSTRGGEFRWPEGIDGLRARRYGEGTLWYGRAAATRADARAAAS